MCNFFEKYSSRQIVSLNGALFNSTQYVDGKGAILPEYDALMIQSFFESHVLLIKTLGSSRSKSSIPAPRFGHDFSQLLFRNTKKLLKNQINHRQIL